MTTKRAGCGYGLFARVFHVLVGLLGVCASAQAQTSHTIRMTDTPPYFDKLSLDIKVGDTVTWVNTGPEMAHIVMDGNMNIYSGDINVNKSWSHTFKKAGVYDYICHRHFFMRARVTVHNPDGSTTHELEFPYQRAFKEFVIPTLQSVPRMIIASKTDDRMWFTEGGGDFYGFEDIPAQNKIASIDAQGRIVEYATPTPHSDGSTVGVDSLVMDKGGDIYFTERLTNRIGVLKPDGTIKEHQIPTKGGYALGVDIDGKGRVWFAERYGNRIGYIESNGAITEIELPEPESEPRTIFVDSKERIWYTARVANEIGYYDPAGKRFVRLQIPTKQARPAGIAEAPDGTIYFVQMVGNKIGKVVGDQIVEYSLPTPFAAPFKIIPDGRGNLWFTEVYANAIGKFNLQTQEITEYKIPTIDSRPGGIAVDKQGRVWFAEQMGNKIGMFDPRLLGDGGAPPLKKAQLTMPATGAAFKVNTALQDAWKGISAISTTNAYAHNPIVSFRIPTAGAGPGNTLVAGNDGWLWFPQVFGNKVGAINLRTREFREIQLPRPVSMPVGIEIGKDRRMWVAEFRGNALAEIDPATGTVLEHMLPWPNTLPSAVALDEAGGVWIALMSRNAIAQFDRGSGRFIQYDMPVADSNPLYITADGNGGLWISAADDSGSYVARFDRGQKAFRIYKTQEPGANPVGLLVDGEYLWVAEGGSGHLSRLNPRNGKWQRYRIPGEKSAPVRIAKDAKGRIWVTDGGEIGSSGGNKLAVFDPVAQRFQTIAMENRDAKPMGIFADSNGDIWFTQQGANRISLIPAEVI